MKVCFVDRVDVDKRKKVTTDALISNERSTSFCWRISDRRGKLINKKYIDEGKGGETWD
jgi:hypothetical protein